MSTNYPILIDSFVNPSGSDTLGTPAVLHSTQHININDSMFALQTRVGVSASTVPNTIDFELHNTASGHNHDGINSRLINLSTSGSASGSGYFPYFNVTTSVGQAVFDINIALLNLSSSITNLVLSGSSSSIAFEAQSVELTPNAVRVNLTGSGVSGSVSSSVYGDKVTYTIPGIDYRQIVFLERNGPFEHFATPDMYHSCTYYPSLPVISASTWYTDISKTYKIFETIYKSRNFRKQATEIIYNVYFEDGITLKSSATDIITYNGIAEASRLRTVT